jgi:glycosyltransferase involved in cell wall biosynthesis
LKLEHITLLTSGQPTANPRLMKEAIALHEAGYSVTVIFVPISPWADSFDEALFKKYSEIKFFRTGYHCQKNKWLYILSRMRRVCNLYLFKKFGEFLNNVDYSTILFGQELKKAAKKHKANLYIAHNLGALPAAVKAARYHNAKVGFDAEDFHRGEFVESSLERRQTEIIENKYFPSLDYLSVASPLIGQAYHQLFPGLIPVVINNVFPLTKVEKKLENSTDTGLQLFWFSQTVGKMRGLECVIEAVGLLKNLSIHLTLLGNTTPDFKEYILQIATNSDVKQEKINFLAPVSDEELFKAASKFDIGIGSETPYCLNREYCLTNKIFTYLMAGNALILSDTKAQKAFLSEFKNIGKLYKHDDPESLASVLSFYAVNKNILATHQKNARELAEKKLNWKIESKKLLTIVEYVLQ